MGASGGGLKILLAVSVAAVVALIVASGIQHRSLRPGSSSGRAFRSHGSHYKGPSDGAPGVGQLGQSIKDVAQSVETIHKRIQTLGKELGTLPPGALDGDEKKLSSKQQQQKQQSAAKKDAEKKEDGAAADDDDKTLSFTLKPRKIKNPAPQSPLVDMDNSIFVSIASYRDEQCAPTIYDMYKQALTPQAIFVGIVEQHDNQDQYCMPKEFDHCQSAAFCPSDQIQIRHIQPKDAKGPTYGRYLGMLMYRGEKYLLMIDSHNRFVTHWDKIAIDMYNTLPTKKGVLSHYPEAWHNPADGQTNPPLDDRQTTTYLCTAKFVEQGYPRLDGFIVHRTAKSREQPWAAAGFLFADAKLLKEVPFDPYLDFVFDGEEILYSIRMWTHGWDIFSPGQNILYHYYYRQKAKKFWSLLPKDWLQSRERAHRRIQWYLGALKPGTDERLVPLDTKDEWVWKENEKYGLGKERTLEQWMKFAGVDMKARKIENKFCPRA